MAMMVEIYNLTGKAEDWAASSPWLSLAHQPALLDALAATRPHMPKLQAFDELRRNGKMDELLIKSFLGSRVFNLRADHRHKAGHGQVERDTQVIMPVIDYFNHRLSAKAFRVNEGNNPLTIDVAGRPDPSTEDVFVRYNQLDAIDTYLIYGFVDAHASYLNTCPLEIRAANHTISVLGMGGLIKKSLPPALRDLRLFMPQVQARADEALTLNKLLIPGPQAPRALQRVLAAVLKNLDVSKHHLRSAIGEAETQLIEQNEAHWQRIRDLASHLDNDHQVHMLWRHCLAHIDQYKRIRPKIH
jgi:hypothetical protein